MNPSYSDQCSDNDNDNGSDMKKNTRGSSIIEKTQCHINQIDDLIANRIYYTHTNNTIADYVDGIEKMSIRFICMMMIVILFITYLSINQYYSSFISSFGNIQPVLVITVLTLIMLSPLCLHTCQYQWSELQSRENSSQLSYMEQQNNNHNNDNNYNQYQNQFGILLYIVFLFIIINTTITCLNLPLGIFCIHISTICIYTSVYTFMPYSKPFLLNM